MTQARRALSLLNRRPRVARLAAVAVTTLLLGVVFTLPTHASNTATSRSFTSHWTCDNGRLLTVNTHPRRPLKEAQLSYAGNRVEVRGAASDTGVRYSSKDGKVVWQSQGAEGLLQFAPLLSEPLLCRLQDKTTNSRQ